MGNALPLRMQRQRPVCASHRRIVRSLEDEARRIPQSSTARDSIAPACPSSAKRQFSVSVSQMRIDPSADPAASWAPPGIDAMRRTGELEAQDRARAFRNGRSRFQEGRIRSLLRFQTFHKGFHPSYRQDSSYLKLLRGS